MEDDFKISLEKFRKANYIDLNEAVKPNISVDNILRKQPVCFKEFGNEFCVYQFNSGTIGLACSGGFEQSLNFKNVQIEYLGRFVFSDWERELLIFYQIIFFTVNFKRIITTESKIREYCYFVLPMKNKEIDFEYIESLYSRLLLDSVCEVKDENILSNYLLFNPITKNFYQYEGASKLKLTDKIPVSLYTKINKMTKKGIIANDLPVVNGEILDENDKKGNETKKQKPKTKDITYHEYFNIFYGCKLANIVDARNIIINASVYSSKNKSKEPEIHSGEVIFVTGIRNTIKKDYQDFLLYFYVFEHCAIAEEFIKDKKLNVSLEAVSSALSQRETVIDKEIDLGYERLEFIGDSVLKFSISKHLFVTKGYDLSTIVSEKDDLICNSHLYSVAQNLDLKRYISFIQYSQNLFQPPAIDKLNELNDTEKKLKDYIDCLKGWGAFKNSNQEYFALKFSQKQTPDNKNINNKKVYADIIEALIGVHYVEFGFDVAWEYIKNIGILEVCNEKKSTSSLGKKPKQKKLKDTQFKDEVKNVLNLLGLSKGKESLSTPITDGKHYLTCEYDKVLSLSKAKKIEKIIGYKFKNIGLLEKAVVHPSYQNNIFGSEKFQKLELVGDCFLDLKVTDYIFKNYPQANPCELHTLRKSFVNNYTFATILFKSGLNDLIQTGLGENHADFKRNKVSKVYSDVFESIAGAVVLDNDFSLEETHDFFTRMFILMKENSREC